MVGKNNRLNVNNCKDQYIYKDGVIIDPTNRFEISSEQPEDIK